MRVEQTWWMEARRLYANPRLSLEAVGRLLKKHNTSVLYAVNAQYRELKREINRDSRARRRIRSEVVQ